MTSLSTVSAAEKISAYLSRCQVLLLLANEKHYMSVNRCSVSSLFQLRYCVCQMAMRVNEATTSEEQEVSVHLNVGL
jgi:DNA phosphorothioation-dependent restriction protein DptG